MARYRGVAGISRKVTKRYRGVDGVARNITEGYRGVDGVARLYFQSGLSWKKYSCNYIAGYYLEDDPPSNMQTLKQGTTLPTTSVAFYQEYSFSEFDGYSVSSPVRFYATDTVNKEDLIGLYFLHSEKGVGSAVYRITEVSTLLSDGTNFTQTMVKGECVEYAYFISSPFGEKGETFYGTVVAPEDELPENGTWIEGSVPEEYYVLKIGSTYYYYELELTEE